MLETNDVLLKVMQIEKTLINDRLRVSKVSGKLFILTILILQ